MSHRTEPSMTVHQWTLVRLWWCSSSFYEQALEWLCQQCKSNMAPLITWSAPFQSPYRSQSQEASFSQTGTFALSSELCRKQEFVCLHHSWQRVEGSTQCVCWKKPLLGQRATQWEKQALFLHLLQMQMGHGAWSQTQGSGVTLSWLHPLECKHLFRGIWGVNYFFNPQIII